QPTATPGTSVMAFHWPGMPSTTRPRPRARGFPDGVERCGSVMRDLPVASRQGSDDHLDAFLFADAEDPLVARDLIGRTGRLVGIVRELHGRPAVRAHGLADEAEGREPVVRREAAEIVGEQRAPAEGDLHPPGKARV